MNDSTLITISWDTTTETLTVAALREKFGKTNLFTGDGVWEQTSYDSQTWTVVYCADLDDVFAVIQRGEEWTCDNCTVSLAEEAQRDPFVQLVEAVRADDDDDDGDMLDTIISMLDGMDADRMASYLMGVQDALNGCVVAKLDNQNERDGDYLAGHKRAQGGAQ